MSMYTAEAPRVTGVKNYQHPLGGREIQVAMADTVWPPYSAFHFAEHVLPTAEKVARRNCHVPVGLDVGTGSGIIPLMAKMQVPEMSMVATDLNPAAAHLAVHNWRLNGFDPAELTAMVADGISPELVAMMRAQGGVDVLFANLPQQPLVNGTDLSAMRRTNAAAWNVDPSRDLDGLGIFESVMGNAHQLMAEGGVALVSASSKQNEPRIRQFLDGLVARGQAKGWETVSSTRFNVPDSYDPHLIDHWKAMEQRDGVQRLYTGPDGHAQYDHYNIAVQF